ncbi:DNA-binding Lrp family transcriptional regulator [Catenulispora sp. GP43]|uniref:hypothetical protein n=1 Tax=Catenulispora sp. GP43 TaxID=3156263 RepID=UPI0035130029
MNDKVEAGLRFLRDNPGTPYSVREIEEKTGLDPKTLASRFNKLVRERQGGIVRADAKYGTNKRVYRGFMYAGD